MRLLDLFCGAGGASVGYARAGWEVVGVDYLRHREYPYEFVWSDAMKVLADQEFIDTFDAIAASPPCPYYSTITPGESKGNHPDLVGPVREALLDIGKPYIIENVENAPLLKPHLLCGSMFGLRTRRHRLFESNVYLETPFCNHQAQGNRTVGVYGDSPDATHVTRPDGSYRGTKARSVAEAQEVLGIDWMSKWADLKDAIPPAYTEFLGAQLLAPKKKVQQTFWAKQKARTSRI